MNALIRKMERKIGKYAIKNISLYLALLYAVGYVVEAVNMNLFNYISLNPYLILHGQIWRLITWIIIPPSLNINLFFMLLLLYVFYNFGTSLERSMGTFRYNLYLFSGMVFTVLGSFVLLIYVYLFQPQFVTNPEVAQMSFAALATFFSTFYIYMSIFLALAVVIPNMQILLMFILPVKMKYIAIIYGFIIGLSFIQGHFYERIVIGASMLNFVIFFSVTRKKTRSPKRMVDRMVYTHEMKKAKMVAKHECTICGVTGEEAPEREFRYCSKCEGNFEYCDQHLYTHQHITDADMPFNDEDIDEHSMKR